MSNPPRKILVTGASRGIGAAISRRLLDAGIPVVGIGRDFSAWNNLPEGMEPANLGESSDTRIAGGDVRVFAVRLEDERIAEILPRGPLSAADMGIEPGSVITHVDGVELTDVPGAFADLNPEE